MLEYFDTLWSVSPRAAEEEIARLQLSLRLLVFHQSGCLPPIWTCLERAMAVILPRARGNTNSFLRRKFWRITRLTSSPGICPLLFPSLWMAAAISMF